MFRIKKLDDILAARDREGVQLRRSLGPVHVTLLGIGAIVGAGIFATVGTAAAFFSLDEMVDLTNIGTLMFFRGQTLALWGTE